MAANETFFCIIASCLPGLCRLSQTSQSLMCRFRHFPSCRTMRLRGVVGGMFRKFHILARWVCGGNKPDRQYTPARHCRHQGCLPEDHEVMDATEGENQQLENCWELETSPGRESSSCLACSWLLPGQPSISTVRNSPFFSRPNASETTTIGITGIVSN